MPGKDNAITGRQICAALGIKSRDLTSAVERERRQGFPICASTGEHPGYYLATSREEMARYCNSLAHRVREVNKTRRACIKTLSTLPEVAETV